MGESSSHVGQAFGRFDFVPGQEKESSPVYRQAHSKEIPTEKEFMLYRWEKPPPPPSISSGLGITGLLGRRRKMLYWRHRWGDLLRSVLNIKMMLKLNRIAILILWGKYSVFVVPIDKTIKGNSYSNLQLVLQDFQIFYVTLFKTGFGTLQVHFNQWGGLYASK